jgi:tripartite-type tricarboxylate transporter receptor subunit TctC
MRPIHALAAAVPLALGALAAPAAMAAEFYKGKNVELTIGANPGGGYDTYARITARHVAANIPGNPTMVPRNRPGAGSRKALNWMLKKAKRDGTVFGAFYPGTLVDPLLRPKRSKYDVTKFNFLGSVNKTARVCFARKDAKAKNFKDVFKTEMILGATQRGGSSRDFAIMFNKFLGTKFKVISGYKGSKGILLAIERGEVEGFCGNSWSSLSAARPQWTKGKFVNNFLMITMKPHKAMVAQGAEPIWKYVKTDKQRKIIEFHVKQQEFGRPYIAPPGVPADRIKVLRAALQKTWHGTAFRKDAADARLNVDPITAQEVKKLVLEIYALPKDLMKEIIATTRKPRKKKKKK